MGAGKGQNRQPISGNIGEAEEQIQQWRGKENQTRQSIEEMQGCIEIAQPLSNGQPSCKKRVVYAQDLYHSAGPPDALLHVPDERFRSQAGSLRQVDVGGIPPCFLQTKRGVGIFCNRLVGNSAPLVQAGTAKHCTGSTEERGIPDVIGILHDAIEEAAFIGNLAELAQVPLERIGGVKVMRSLQHRQLGVAQKPTDGDLQEGACGDMVAIEDSDKLALALAECVI